MTMNCMPVALFCYGGCYFVCLFRVLQSYSSFDIQQTFIVLSRNIVATNTNANQPWPSNRTFADCLSPTLRS